MQALSSVVQSANILSQTILKGNLAQPRNIAPQNIFRQLLIAVPFKNSVTHARMCTLDLNSFVSQSTLLTIQNDHAK